MHIADNWWAPLVFLNPLLIEIAITHIVTKSYPLSADFYNTYTYQLQGDFIEYIKRECKQ
jgi:hypothetical protein